MQFRNCLDLGNVFYRKARHKKIGMNIIVATQLYIETINNNGSYEII